LDKNKEVKDKIDPIIEKVEALKDLEAFVENLEDRTNDKNDPISSLSKNEVKKINDILDDLKTYPKKNPEADAKEITDKKEKEIEKLEPLLNKASKLRDLSEYGNNMRKRLDKDDLLSDMLSDQDKKAIRDATDELENWLKNNPNATAEEIDEKRRELEKKLEPIIKKAKKRKDFTEYIGGLRERINDQNDPLSKLSNEDKKKILNDLAELNEWLKNNPNATEEEIDQKKREFEKKHKEILDKIQNITNFEKDIDDNKNKIKDLSNYLSNDEKTKANNIVDKEKKNGLIKTKTKVLKKSKKKT